MAVSANAAAYGAVVVAAVALLIVGPPADRSAALDARLASVKPPTPAYSLELDKQVAAYVAAVGPHAAPAVAEAAGIKLRSVGFDLPTSDRAFPPGPGVDQVAGNCLACHSAGMILNQPRLTQVEWTGEVNKMIHVYKAPVEQESVAGIATYLAGLKVAP